MYVRDFFAPKEITQCSNDIKSLRAGLKMFLFELHVKSFSDMIRYVL